LELRALKRNEVDAHYGVVPFVHMSEKRAGAAADVD
jgi:hypothetical protein